MSDWENALSDINDDYLIGLSNKGIVKRAYKDREEVKTKVLSADEEAKVKVGEETVVLQIPLAKSSCSCPSRSICRHVVLAVLILKEHLSKSETQNQNEEQNQNEAQNQSETQNQNEAQNQSKTQNQSEAQNQTPQKNSGLLAEIRDYPNDKLRKAMGSRGFVNFVKKVRAGIKPEINFSNIASVKLPDGEFKVTLLSPIEYSTCTCHKNTFCAHKAEAVLWCKLNENFITKEELSGEILESPEFDMEEISYNAKQMKELLLRLLETGLTRTSSDMADNIERMSIISHNLGLANFEGYFRALFDSYKRYEKRVASFRTGELLMQIMRLYFRVNMLLSENSATGILKLAGQFRADYLEAGDLNLKGVAASEFESKTGYAGQTIYFLEENTQEWYTYTVARPTFYDTKKNRKYMNVMQSPWGLDIPIEQLSRVSILLNNAKCDERKRLSSSSDSKAQVISFNKKDVDLNSKWYYDDFERLFEERVHIKEDWLAEFSEGEREENTYVFVQPAFCEKARFDEASQTLTMPLYDECGKKILIEMVYSKKEDLGIRYVERINLDEPPCFMGRLYLKDGELRLYPIEVFETGRKASEFVKNELDEAKEARLTSVRTMSELLREISSLMEDIFQSGFDTIGIGTIEEIERLSTLSGQYGMAFMEKALAAFYDTLNMRRHRSDRENAMHEGLGEEGSNRLWSSPADIMADIMQYIFLCREKLAVDMAAIYYGGKNYDDTK